MTYVLGCIKEGSSNCECDPGCCTDTPPPNVNINLSLSGAKAGPELDQLFDAKTCCFGPWDVLINKSDGSGWVLDATLYCLADIGLTYRDKPHPYIVVLSGETADWDPVMDDRTPECFWEIDPYNQ